MASAKADTESSAPDDTFAAVRKAKESRVTLSWRFHLLTKPLPEKQGGPPPAKQARNGICSPSLLQGVSSTSDPARVKGQGAPQSARYGCAVEWLVKFFHYCLYKKGWWFHHHNASTECDSLFGKRCFPTIHISCYSRVLLFPRQYLFLVAFVRFLNFRVGYGEVLFWLGISNVSLFRAHFVVPHSPCV